jgi:hypothetical protein
MVMNDATPRPARKAGDIDLEAISKLVADLEQDLEKVRQGTQDVEALRQEVRALSRVLGQSAAAPAQVGRGLRNIHALVTNAREIAKEDAFKTAEYAARIGRMLGM